MILAIDFDGTIVEDAYPEIGLLKPNAAEVIRQLKRNGHYIIIWSCRAKMHKLHLEAFLKKVGIPYDQINKSNPDNVAKYGGVDPRKVYADIYIDDKAIGGLPHWTEIYNYIEELEFLKTQQNI